MMVSVEEGCYYTAVLVLSIQLDRQGQGTNKCTRTDLGCGIFRSPLKTFMTSSICLQGLQYIPQLLLLQIDHLSFWSQLYS